MGKLLKVLGALLGFLILLVIAAVIILPLVVDPNDFKEEIIAQVEQYTDRDLRIDGNLGLSVFPWLGLELNGLELKNAEGFDDEPFALVQHAQVRAKLQPLMKRQLVVDEVRIEGLRLNLTRNEAGVGNWEDLIERFAREERSNAVKAPAGAQPVPGIDAFVIGGIEMTASEVSWNDQQAGQRVSIQGLDLATGAIEPGQPVDLTLTCLLDSQAPTTKANIDLKATLALSEAGDKLSVEPLQITLQDLRTGDGLSAAVQLDAALALDLAANQGVVKPFRVEIRDLNTAQGITGGATLEALLEVDLTAQRYRIGNIELDLDARGEQFPKGKLDAKATAEMLLDLAAQTLSLDGLVISAADLSLTGAATGSQLLESPRFKGKLALAEINLRGWLQQQGLPVPETADPKVLQRLAFATNWQTTKDQIHLQQTQLRLDDSTLTGDVRILQPAQPGYRFRLNLDRIDLDRYRPPSGQKPESQPSPAPVDQQAGRPAPASAQEVQPLFPVELIRGLDLDGRLSVAQLKAAELNLEQALFKVTAKGGTVTIDNQVERFYGGGLKGSLGLDVRGQQPQVNINEQASGIQAGPLLNDLTGEGRLTGTGRFGAKLHARGQTASSLQRSLGGNISFLFAKGAVKGFNLARMIREAKAKLQGKILPPSKEPVRTDFTELSASAVVAQGVAKNNDLAAKSPYLRVTGQGTVDIGEETLDYLLKTTIVQTPKGQGGKDLKELEGILVPVRVTGAWAKPAWAIDIATALKEVGKRKVIEKIEKDDRVKEQIQKLEEKTGIKGLGEGLKGLFGN